MLLRVMLCSFNFRQSNRRRRVWEREPNEEYASERNCGGKEKRQSPTDKHQINAKNDEYSSPHGGRDVSKRHFAREVVGWKTKRPQARTRWKAPSLETTVQHAD